MFSLQSPKTYKALIEHNTTVHKNADDFRCLFCEKGPFGTVINLADHMTTDHSFKESGGLKADLGVDKSSGALIKHNATVHKNAEEFMCRFCEKGPFGTMINLADHMTTDHSYEESGKLKADLDVEKTPGELKTDLGVDKSSNGK